ncbi:MAG: hypothetical protein ACRDZ3_08735 [Acidimicrobiia bacterium]
MPDEALFEAMDALHDRYDQVELTGRTIRLETPVNGDAGFAALRMLAIAQAASPVGVATHGPAAVAIAVWRPPDLYLARWTQNRWDDGFRRPRGSKPGDSIGAEGRIPSRLETGNWYLTVPDEVHGAFGEVGLSLEAPPFPPPVVEPPPPKAKPAARRKPAAPARPTTPKPAAHSRAETAPKPPPPPTSKVCPSCNMRRALTQFGPGSDLCVDCR